MRGITKSLLIFFGALVSLVGCFLPFVILKGAHSTQTLSVFESVRETGFSPFIDFRTHPTAFILYSTVVLLILGAFVGPAAGCFFVTLKRMAGLGSLAGVVFSYFTYLHQGSGSAQIGFWVVLVGLIVAAVGAYAPYDAEGDRQAAMDKAIWG